MRLPPPHPAPPGYPADAVILAPAVSLAFLHLAQAQVNGAHDATTIWRLAMARPLPGLRVAFRVRDFISARFGVARIGGFSGSAQPPIPGGKLDVFLVEAVSPQSLVLTARDSHLDVMICITAQPCAQPCAQPAAQPAAQPSDPKPMSASPPRSSRTTVLAAPTCCPSPRRTA